MQKPIIISMALWLLITLLLWLVTNGYYKKQYGEKAWKQWTVRLYYWQVILYTSMGLTILTIWFLKWAEVWTF